MSLREKLALQILAFMVKVLLRSENPDLKEDIEKLRQAIYVAKEETK